MTMHRTRHYCPCGVWPAPWKYSITMGYTVYRLSASLEHHALCSPSNESGAGRRNCRRQLLIRRNSLLPRPADHSTGRPGGTMLKIDFEAADHQSSQALVTSDLVSVAGFVGTMTGFESLQYNLPATSLIIQSIPPSSPDPVTAEQE